MRPASWPRRFGALFVDWFSALAIAGIFTGRGIFADPEQPMTWPQFLAPFGVYWLLVTLATGTIGVTLGKWIFGLGVVDAEGRPIGLARAAVRSLLVMLVLPAALLAEHRRGLQDVAAGSIVVQQR